MNPAADPRRWAEVLATFDEIVELAPDARAERLVAIGAGDPELRGAIEDLLAADAAVDARLARLDGALGSASSHVSATRYDSDALNLVGRTISHFRVLAPLAQGGMGIVYRAEDTRLGRAVALKFPLRTNDLDRSAKERFLHEARFAGALDHPNLCGIYEAGETDDGHLFHAMPLYSGETLRTRLERDGALPVTEALGIAKQIAHGLSAAHKAGIVHRDLKPANVMLLPDGTVKILDFGLARTKDLSLTASQAALGTVSYMAPEQVLGRPLDGRADLWALGVVIYEMLTGTRPFEGEQAAPVMHAIIHSKPVWPLTLRGEVTPAVEGVVLSLLSKEPAKRHASAEDVATALAAIQLGEASLPRVPSGTSGSARGRRRAWVTAAIVGAMLVAAIPAGVWLSSGAAVSTPPAARAVAVLPFDDLTDAKDLGHIAVGVSDAIATELSRVRSTIVPSPYSTLPYRTRPTPPLDVAAALNASAVVTGSVRRVGDRVHVDVGLVDAKSNKQLWARRFDHPVTDVVDIQRDATRAIVAALRIDVTDAERAFLERPVTTNAQAYDFFLRGREVELRKLARETGDRVPTENVVLAQSFYSRARDLDPTFAVARARLAVMLMLGATTYDTTQARREQARLEAETALRLHPGLAEAHAALASYWRWGGRDFERSDQGARAGARDHA